MRTDDRYPWVAMGVVLIGTFMVIMDTTIVNVALPQIGVALHSTGGIEWIVTAYLLAVGVAQAPTGWLADRVGRKQVFVAGLLPFGAGSLFAALSPTLGVLIIARVVQGLGGGAIGPVGMTMIYELFPPDRRGTALGVWGVAAMAAPAFGPVLGGYLVTAVSWHWLFLINVPVCVVGVTAALRLLRDTGYREQRPFDATGLGLVSVAMICWLYGFAQASEWGWEAAATITLLVAGAVLLATFVWWERRTAHPVIDPEMFRTKIFSLTLVTVAFGVGVQYSILVFLPLQLETLHDLDALRVGTMLVPMAIGAAITFPLGGKLTDTIGPRYPVVTGFVLLATSAWILSNVDPGSSTGTIELAVIVQGLGYGFALMPNSVTGLNSLPKRFVASASGVRQLNQRVAASLGVAVLATVLAMRSDGETQTGTLAGYHTLFGAVCVVAVIGAVLAIFLPGKARNRELLEARALEDAELLIDVA